MFSGAAGVGKLTNNGERNSVRDPYRGLNPCGVVCNVFQ